MTSKVYLFRHGETEWSKNGRHTGKTDLPLTKDGEVRIQHSAARLLGDDALITPSSIAQIYVSPRQRARRTLELLALPSTIPVQVTDRIEEWSYGRYEGLTSVQINNRLDASAGSNKSGIVGGVDGGGGGGRNGPWNVFRDGCPDGDDAVSVTKRVDSLINEIRDRHRDAQESERQDVLIVAHGHILRAFAARWIGDPVQNGTRFAYGAGGAGVLGYEHGNIDEPTIEVWNVTDLTLK